MAKYATGIFTPTNAQKYIGKHAPRYRSGWEFTFMKFCDSNPSILHWASEAIAIPYMNPVTGKRANYIPDFFVVYVNKNGKQLAEVVEIKPQKQSIVESKMAAGARLVVAVNHAKWAAAKAYCAQQGFTFRVVTENDLFRNGRA